MKISKQVKHEIRYTASQRMIVNNQVHDVPGQPYSTFVCPTCGYSLVELQGQIPETKMAEAISSLTPDFRRFSYCPGCGEKLDYDICSVIDGEILEERTE